MIFRDTHFHTNNMTTTLSISKQAKTAGAAIAKAERRSFSGQVEVLILEEATRRGIQVEETARKTRSGKRKEVAL